MFSSFTILLWKINTSAEISIEILIFYHPFPFTITFLLFMLLTADSLWKYTDSCHNIYCLPLIYFIILKTEINRYYFDTLNCFVYFTCCPFIPTCSYTTSILIAPSKMAAGGERCGKGNNILDTYSDQMQRITQVLPADSRAENKNMWNVGTKKVCN